MTTPHSSMKQFVLDENDKRTDSFRKDVLREHCFARMNTALRPLEEVYQSDKLYPTLFIFGLPRSGTTLSYQLITQCFNLGYINNLIARFWLAPQHGIALSQAVLEPVRIPEFHSNLGQTTGPQGPHEFAYFWQHWLKISTVDDMMIFDSPHPEIDWPGLVNTVRSMQQMFDAGIVFKTSYAPSHIRAFANNFPLPLFIYIERDPVDIGLSLLAARKKIYGRHDSWWSNYTPNYRELVQLPFDQQIAGQVHSLIDTYEAAVKCISSDLVVRLEYSCICEAPGDALSMVQTRLADIHGINVATRSAPPNRFEFHTRPDNLNADQRAVVKAIQAWGN